MVRPEVHQEGNSQHFLVLISTRPPQTCTSGGTEHCRRLQYLKSQAMFPRLFWFENKEKSLLRQFKLLKMQSNNIIKTKYKFKRFEINRRIKWLVIIGWLYISKIVDLEILNEKNWIQIISKVRSRGTLLGFFPA